MATTSTKHPLVEREARAFNRMTNLRRQIRDAYEYCLPGQKHDLDGMMGDSAPERPMVLDSTAADALAGYADRFMTRYTPPNERFVRLQPGIQLEIMAPAALDQVREILDMIVDLFDRLLENSAFYQTVHRAYLDYGVTGGCFNFNEVADPNKPFGFEVIPIWQVTPEEGPGGTANTTFRRWKVLARNIEATWPDARIGNALAATIKDQPDAEVNLVEAMVFDHRANRYDYVVVDKEHGEELVSRTASEGARILFRNMLPAGVALGIGPAIRQLPNIRQLNKHIEYWLLCSEAQAMSRWQAPRDHPVYQDGGVLDLEPGVVIPFGPQGPMQALQAGGALGLEQAMIERLQEQIREAFLNDNLPPLSGDVRSATEIIERTRNAVEAFDPSATRNDQELLRPLAKRGLEIMTRQGIMPPLRIDGLRVKIQADGPLARVRRQNEARARLSWMGEVIQTLGGEAVFGTSDVEAFTAELLEDGGIGGQFVLDEREREERRAQVIQEQLAMQALEAPAGQGQAA